MEATPRPTRLIAAALSGESMDFIITVCRLPFGVAASLVCAVFWLVLWPFEMLLGALLVPLCAVFMNRFEIKETFGSWPCNCLVNLEDNLSNIWKWVEND